MKTRMALAIAAIMIISVLSVAFTAAASGENASHNITDSNLTEIVNETLPEESSAVESNLTEVNETAIEEQQQRFLNPYYERWKKQYEPPFGYPKSAEEMNKWIEEKGMPKMPKAEEGIIPRAYKGTYFNITGNYSELWNQTHDVNDTYAYVVPDMDGDGNEDVIVQTYKHRGSPYYDYTYKVIAKKGSDGKELWNESVSGSSAWLYAYPAGDLDGDDLCDVIVQSYKYRSYPYYDYEYKVIAKKGSDGTNLWTKSITTSSSAEMYAYPAGDLNGDGLSDVIVNSYRYKGYPDYKYEYRTEARIGKNGTELWNESFTTSNWGDLYAYPAGDLTGDGVGDVIVEMYKYSYTAPYYNYKVIAKKGSDGTNLWSESMSTSSYSSNLYAYPAGDLNGDGAEDAIVEMYKYDRVTGKRMYKVIAKKGSDGTQLWEESMTTSYYRGYLYVYPAGDLDGDSADDVILNSYNYTGTYPYYYTYKVAAKIGKNGTELWDETISTSYSARLYGYPVGDLNGDDLCDVLVRSYKYRGSPYYNYEYKVKAKIGKNGTELWSESITGSSVSMDAYPIGDLNGDNLCDVLVESYKYRGYPYHDREYKVKAKIGKNGTDLWSDSLTTKYRGDLYAYPAGDLNGDDILDVIVDSRNQTSSYPDNYEYKVKAKIGKNGTELWNESISGRYAYLEAYPMRDLDGDNADDVLVKQYKGTYNPWTEKWTYNYTAIAKKGSDGTHFWTAKSDGRIWVAYPYYGYYYYYGYGAYAHAPMGIMKETMPAEMPMNITTQSVVPLRPIRPIPGGNISYKYGYDLNGDGAYDTVLGNTTSVYAITVSVVPVTPPPPPFNLTRDLPAYAFAGETITVNITFHPTKDINSVGLHDEAPSDWNTSVNKDWCSPTADFAKATKNITEYIWYNIKNGTEVTASYKVTIPKDATCEYTFNGYLEYYIGTEGPYRAKIGGDQVIPILPFPMERTLPDIVVAGYDYNVSITFHPNKDINSVGLHDEAPSGWNVSVSKTWTNPTADFAKATKNVAEYIWYNIANGTEVTATYRFSVPEDTKEDNYSFYGYLEYYVGTNHYKTVIPFECTIPAIPGFPIQGTTGEVICTALGNTNIFVYNSTTGDFITSTTSNANGNYTAIVKELGSYKVVANKTGFKNATRTVSVTSEKGSELNFRGSYGLVPKDPDMSYILKCINNWLYTPADPECKLTMSKVLEVINEWLY